MAVRLSKQASRATGKVQLPPGYEVITGSFALKFEFKKPGDMLAGKVVRTDSIELKKGKQSRTSRVIEVETDDGVKYALWEAAALRGLFDEVDVGDEIAVQYLGEKKITGQRNPMHDFACGFKSRPGNHRAKPAAKKSAKK